MNLADIIQHNDMISQSSQTQSNKSLYDDNIQSEPKKSIHPVFFILNILWMLFICYASLIYIYGDGQTYQDMYIKGKWAAASLICTLVIAIPTFLYLVSLKQLLRLFIIVDTIMVVTIAAALGFVYLILIFDQTDEWYWSMIEAAFSIELAFYSTMFRVFFVHLKWPRWQLLVFKLSTMANCLMYLICGVYFIVKDYSYTHHYLQAFDKKVHDFMILFIFSLFTYCYQLYCKVTDLDRTGQLRYAYAVRDVDPSLSKKKKSIIKKKRESINSIKLLRKSFQVNQQQNKNKISRFAQIEVVQAQSVE